LFVFIHNGKAPIGASALVSTHWEVHLAHNVFIEMQILLSTPLKTCIAHFVPNKIVALRNMVFEAHIICENIFLSKHQHFAVQVMES
jgi:hypothetical protein